MKKSKNYIAVPPGATIKEQLIDRGISEKEFASRMDMPERNIEKLLNGEIHLTPDIAAKLEKVLGIPSAFWSNLETFYRNKLIKVEAENAKER